MTPDTAKVIRAKINRLLPSASPPIVDISIDGIRAKVASTRYSGILIFVIPIAYVIRSLGVPGIKKSRQTRAFRFFESLSMGRASIFSLGYSDSTKARPSFRESNMTITEPRVIPIRA